VCLAAATLLAMGVCALADVKPNSLFSDNAVLQQGISVPVWGTAPTARGLRRIPDSACPLKPRAASGWCGWKPLKPGGPFTMTIEGFEQDRSSRTCWLVRSGLQRAIEHAVGSE